MPHSPANWRWRGQLRSRQFLHLINGLFDAHRSRVPVLAIAAHIPGRTEIGSEYFQETPPADLFRECSVYCEPVGTPRCLPRILEMAMRAASRTTESPSSSSPARSCCNARHGWTSRPVRPTRSIERPDDESVRRAADILNGAERITHPRWGRRGRIATTR